MAAEAFSGLDAIRISEFLPSSGRVCSHRVLPRLVSVVSFFVKNAVCLSWSILNNLLREVCPNLLTT